MAGKPTTTIRLIPCADQGLIELVVRHGLVELPLPVTEPPASKLAARWLWGFCKQRPVRLMVGKGGERWIVTRNPAGLIEYASIEEALRFVERESRSANPDRLTTLSKRQENLFRWIQEQINNR